MTSIIFLHTRPPLGRQLNQISSRNFVLSCSPWPSVKWLLIIIEMDLKSTTNSGPLEDAKWEQVDDTSWWLFALEINRPDLLSRLFAGQRKSDSYSEVGLFAWLHFPPRRDCRCCCWSRKLLRGRRCCHPRNVVAANCLLFEPNRKRQTFVTMIEFAMQSCRHWIIHLTGLSFDPWLQMICFD